LTFYLRITVLQRISQVMGEIMNQVKIIESAAVVIADLSGSNPNVYLEVGYAGRPTILLIKAGEEPKFDVRGYKHLKYE
jgi:hypothetical protein